MQNNKTQRLLGGAIVFAIILVINVFVFNSMRRRRSRIPPPPVTQGTPEQVKRIKDRIVALEKEDLDDLVFNLNQQEEFANPALGKGKKGSQANFEKVLASRRSLKLLQVLGEQPRTAAAKNCQDIFTRLLSEHQSTMERILKSYDDPSAPKNTQSMMGNLGGLCTAVFLSANFLDAGSVAEQLNRIDKVAATVENRLSTSDVYPDSLKAAITKFARPDNSFKANALIYAIHHDPKFDNDLRKKSRSLLDSVPVAHVEFVSWNAKTTPYDVTHVVEGVPVDKSKGHTEIEVFSLDGESPDQQLSLLEYIVAFIKDN